MNCDKSNYCKAKETCPIPKHIRDTIKERFKDDFKCPKGIFYKSKKIEISEPVPNKLGDTGNWIVNYSKKKVKINE